MSEPTVPMYGNAITAHMLRKQHNPTGQVTFFGTIHERNTDNIFRNAFSEHRNTPEQYTPHNKTTRTTRKEAPAPHGTGASPMLLCR